LSEAERGPEEGTGPGEEARRSRRSWLRYAPLAVFGILAIVFAIQLGGGGSSDLDSALLDQAVPEFDLPPLIGLANAAGQIPGFSSESLAGQVTVVNVFASWCVPCRQEHPQIITLASDDRYVVYGINHTDQPENALQFLNDLGNPYHRAHHRRTARRRGDALA
jgi:cytochrome c biogenesis protein CcmG/thiol:disulfide interchange protein DsbE